MTTARDVAAELRDLAEHLAPDLALELYRLQDLERDHQAAVQEISNLRRALHESTVMVGELRQRTVRAETQLSELGAEEIRRARAHAFMHGTGVVRITSRGRGQFATLAIHPDDVTIRTRP
ncbi:hypothetical protein GCM10022215_29530 [Nocardioides fonticola]|uniref:Uncharacterized protein n=1 Tax=Nocardioides fonticola TaxID=450363 RepID=A0ABP7XP80_9ACTN